jgi:hypothetical protein
LASLVGDGTGTATRVGTGAGESQVRTGLLDVETGAGDAGQGATPVGRPVGAGTGAAVPIRLGRVVAVLGTGTGAALRPAVVGAVVGTALAGAGVAAPVGAADGTAEAESTRLVPSVEGASAVCDALADA